MEVEGVGGVSGSLRVDGDGAPVLVLPTTTGSHGHGGSDVGGQQLWRKRLVRLLSYGIGLESPPERDVALLLWQYAACASCTLALNKVRAAL